MYNPQLDTFLHVADAGSFNKAAEESYITPTAVIKQINLLEASLMKPCWTCGAAQGLNCLVSHFAVRFLFTIGLLQKTD